MRYAITLSYSGADFCGWQIQPRDPSVQAGLEHALSTLLGTPIRVTGAGRTDTGVNAVGYVAHFDAPEPFDAAQMRYKLNAILPASIAVLDLRESAEDFHARFDARRREYTYFLHTVKDPFVAAFSYRCPYRLDFKRMNEAARALAGTHDFSCFEKVGGDNKTSVCTVSEAFWAPYTPTISAGGLFPRQDSSAEGLPASGNASPLFPAFPEAAQPEAAPYWYFRIAADRFLRNMVRAIVGTLLEVGRGRRTVEEFAALVTDTPQEDALPARCLAGESVPGHALFLSGIDY